MAQITLITGTPGDGKSLLAITKGLEFVKQGRTVYAAGFKELNYEATGFVPLPSAFDAFDRSNVDDNGLVKPDWMLLENSVIIYDECYSVMPSRAAGRPVPVHIEALARHRHYNIDFIFVCQKHDQIDNFVRGLVKEHIHVMRKFGLNGAVLKTWDCFQLNTGKKGDSSPLWRYPKQNYSLYKSATAHSIKKKIPWYLWAPIPLVGIIVGCGLYVKNHFGSSASAVAPTTGAAAPGVGAAALGSGGNRVRDQDDLLRQRDYAAWMRPRIAGQPWTAPAWDQLQPQGVPDLFCIAVEDGRCECRTEQGTRYELEPRICRTIAREGIYNPFRKPIDPDRQQRRRDDDRGRDGGQGDVASGSVASSTWRQSAMRQPYVPPELTTAPGG